MSTIYVTRGKHIKMAEEIESLKGLLEQAQSQKVRARSEGDLSENSAFDDAVRSCDTYGRMLIALQAQYDSASVVTGINTSNVGVLTKVRLKYRDNNQEMIVTIVSSGQGVPGESCSIDSAIGKALQDKSVGAAVEFTDNTFKKRIVKILSIEEAD